MITQFQLSLDTHEKINWFMFDKNPGIKQRTRKRGSYIFTWIIDPYYGGKILKLTFIIKLIDAGKQLLLKKKSAVQVF